MQEANIGLFSQQGSVVVYHRSQKLSVVEGISKRASIYPHEDRDGGRVDQCFTGQLIHERWLMLV